MKYLSNINRPHNCWILFEKECASSYIFMCYFFLCAQQLKITKLPMRENFESTRKNFGHAKYPQKKISDLQNTQEKKSWTNEIWTRKNWDPRNTHEKIFWTHKISWKAHDDTEPMKFNTLSFQWIIELLNLYLETIFSDVRMIIDWFNNIRI